jgi:hypothetical protein
MLGDEWWFYQSAGDVTQDPTFDLTPSTRAAPKPKGILSGPIPNEGPEAIANQLQQSATIHGIKAQAGLRAMFPPQALGIQQDDWMEIWQVEPGHSEQLSIPKQMMSSGFMWGTRDRTQSFARQNEFGFDSSHMHRRYATGPIPGNNMWMQPGGRPLVKNLAGPARPAIGVDSPFHGDDLGAAFSIDGAYLQNLPTQYVPVPQPNLAASMPGNTGDDAVIEWY